MDKNSDNIQWSYMRVATVPPERCGRCERRGPPGGETGEGLAELAPVGSLWPADTSSPHTLSSEQVNTLAGGTWGEVRDWGEADVRRGRREDLPWSGKKEE